jgi:outer membrane protein TolC
MQPRASLAISLTVLLSGPAQAGLADLVAKALANDPAQRAADADADHARALRREARAARWPVLRLSSAFTRSDDPVYVFGSLLRRRDFTAPNFALDFLNNPPYHNLVATSLEVGAPLYLGGETSRRVEWAGHRFESASLQAETARQARRLAVIHTYIDAALARAQSRALAERLAESEDEIRNARRLTEKGLVLGSDFYAAQALRDGLRAWAAQTDARADAASARLAVLTGEPPAVPPSLGAAGYAVPDEATLLARLAERPDLRGARADERAARSLEGQTRARTWPRLEAFAVVETDTEDLGRNPSHRAAGLRAAWTLADPAAPARGAQARAAVQAAGARADAAGQTARADTVQAFTIWKAAVRTLPTLEDAESAADRALNLFRPLYREGRQSLLDVLRAEDGLARAQTARLETLAEIHRGYARLHFAAGVLSDDTVRDMDARLAP